MYSLILVLSLLSQFGNLDPDFNIPTEAGKQVFREELAIAIAQNPGANSSTRKDFKREAEDLAAKLLLKGQKIHGYPHKKLKVYWDRIRLDEIGHSDASNGYVIQLSEIMFFTYHQDYLETVIPHEVAHLLHVQHWGVSNSLHDETFEWQVKEIAPNYVYKDLDKMPACRLLRRLVESYGYHGKMQVCE